MDKTSLGALAALLIACALLALVLIGTEKKPAENEQLKIFEEVDEIRLAVDERGSAHGWAKLMVVKSELADFMRFFAYQVGTDIMQQEYESGWKSSFAMLGVEVDSVRVTVDNGGENFAVLVEWESPHLARWGENGWTITMAWVDPESAASEVLGNILSEWLTVSGIAKEYGYRGCVLQVRSVTRIILPEWADDVWSNAFENEEYVEYGRGSYDWSRFYLEWENGRPVVVENSLTVLDTRHLIEVRAENFLENHVPLVITYAGPGPRENFEDLLSEVCSDLKFGRIRESYSFVWENRVENLTLGQILYNASLLLLGGNNFSPSFAPVELIGEMAGEWKTALAEMRRESFLPVAEEIVGRGPAEIPASLNTPWGRARYFDVLYNMLRAIRSENSILFLPVPSGELLWENERVEAKLAYYLLPDPYVKTGTPRVMGVLENLRAENKLALAEKICNWTGSNILYSLSFRPPTSEEVLESRRGQCRDYSNAYLALARTAGLPSRRVSGWVESEWTPPAGWGFGAATTPDGKKVILHAWVQVYIPGTGWLDVEPQSTRPQLYVGELPYRVYASFEQSWTDAIAEYESAGGRI